MDRKTENQLRREIAEVWALLDAERAGRAALIRRIEQEEQSVPVVGEPDCYDAGLLGDFGGGNVEWWQDYIRAELARAHDFYASQWPSATPAADLATLREKAAQLEQVEKERDEANARLHDVSVACATAEQERDELRKDAERYRWIRDPKSPADKVILFDHGAKGKGVFAFIALDECIDAAIAQEPKK